MGTTSCLNGVSTGARRPGPGTVSGPGDPPCGGCPGRAGGDRVQPAGRGAARPRTLTVRGTRSWPL